VRKIAARHTIVVAVDGTPAAGRALELVDRYDGDRSGLRVVCTNVQTRPVSIWPEASVDVRLVEETLLAAGRGVAGEAAAKLRGSGFAAEPAVRLGSPADAIVREAQSREAEIIIVGTRGHGVLDGFALGSVAMRVAHASPIPVMLVRPDSRLPAHAGRKLRILLAQDGSEPAVGAATALASWRPWLGELDVQIVYVQQPLAYLETVLPPHDDVIGQWSTAAGESAAKAARDLFRKERISHHLHLTLGDPATEIVHLADETGCELVVMGTRGLGAAHHALIGSVALKVAARAMVPVALVKQYAAA
jgi:nucleotide-binding universal stress UspA family protein